MKSVQNGVSSNVYEGKREEKKLEKGRGEKKGKKEGGGEKLRKRKGRGILQIQVGVVSFILKGDFLKF